MSLLGADNKELELRQGREDGFFTERERLLLHRHGGGRGVKWMYGTEIKKDDGVEREGSLEKVWLLPTATGADFNQRVFELKNCNDSSERQMKIDPSFHIQSGFRIISWSCSCLFDAPPHPPLPIIISIINIIGMINNEVKKHWLIERLNFKAAPLNIWVVFFCSWGPPTGGKWNFQTILIHYHFE